MNEEVKVKSLAKALKILGCFNSKTPELGITQLSSMLDLNKSNVHSIVTTFEQEGYLEKNPVSGKYRLGLKLLEFSYVINENLGYQRALYDIMRDVSLQLSAVSYFAVPRDGQVFYLCNTYPSVDNQYFPYRSIIGEKAPFYCTSLGKVMLAFLPEDEVQQYIEAPKHKFTDSTIVEPDALREEIAKIRLQGYSMDDGEHEYGIRCFGVPVFAVDGRLVGAFSVSGSTATFELEKVADYVKILKEAAFKMRERV